MTTPVNWNKVAQTCLKELIDRPFFFARIQSSLEKINPFPSDDCPIPKNANKPEHPHDLLDFLLRERHGDEMVKLKAPTMEVTGCT